MACPAVCCTQTPSTIVLSSNLNMWHQLTEVLATPSAGVEVTKPSTCRAYLVQGGDTLFQIAADVSHWGSHLGPLWSGHHALQLLLANLPSLPLGAA